MRTRGAAVAAAAGATALALLALGIGVGQAQSVSTASPAGTGNGYGYGNGHTNTNTNTNTNSTTSTHRQRAATAADHGPGPGMQGPGAGVGGAPVATVALSTEQRADLLAMVEEEKLAGDVYAVLADRYDDGTFTRIAASEDRHAEAVRRLLDRYGIDDPTSGLATGEFATPAFQALYDELMARASVSLEAAYAVGADIERLDIDDLTAAIDTAEGRSDIVRVYTHLRTASTQHLAAFTA